MHADLLGRQAAYREDVVDAGVRVGVEGLARAVRQEHIGEHGGVNAHAICRSEALVQDDRCARWA